MFPDSFASSCPGLAERIHSASCVISTASGERSTPYRFSWRMNAGHLFGQILGVRFAQLDDMADDFVVARFQGVVGLEQKRPAAAGRINDFQFPQHGQTAAPILPRPPGPCPDCASRSETPNSMAAAANRSAINSSTVYCTMRPVNSGGV